VSLRRVIAFTGLTVFTACSSGIQETPPAASAAAKEPAPEGATSSKTETAAAPRGTLYERLGGRPAVTAVVDAFLKRVAADKRINGRFMNTDLTRLRTHLIEFVSSATGGKVEYTGRDMHVTHAGLQIVDEEFDALVEDLVGALVELKVPAAEKGELLGALGPLKPKIVSPPPAAEAKHDPALAERAGELAATLRREGKGPSADLLEMAVKARVRGQRNYAEQLFSAVERQLPAGRLDAVALLFREGAPERITTALVQMPTDTPPQPKLAVGGSDEDEAPHKESRASLTGKLTIERGPGLLGVITLDRVGGKSTPRLPKKRIIEQRDRQFAPRLLAVPVNSTVAFPNFDPVYHNVFSVSPAKAFDLGIYKNGEAREVVFGKEGLIRLGCNLHSNMTAHVVVVGSAHYVVTSPGGEFAFRSLSPGKYSLRAWSEDSTEPVSRTLVIHAGANTLDMSIPHGSAGGLGTDKFGVSRGGDDR
jgi:hemoglobin